jgi:alkylation response protein AidB-like acyl-CoA dehydrogenase
MDFDFTDDQYAFRESVRAFLGRHYPGPESASPRPNDIQHQALWTGLAELGLFSILVPEAAGGLGLDFVDLALLIEELGRVAASPLLIDTLVASHVLSQAEVSRQLLPLVEKLATGDQKVALAFSEPGAEDGPAGLESTITREGGRYRVFGRKMLVAEALRADYLLVACSPQRGDGALAIIPTKEAGVSIRLHECLDITAAYYEVSFDVAVVPENILVCNDYPNAQEHLFDAAALAAALLCTGIAGRALDGTLEFVRQRMQFGKPIGSFQAIKHRCADLAVKLGSSRSAAYYASWAFANQQPDQQRAISIAKSYCADTARLACNEAIQMYGGMGFTWDQGLHFFLRRTKMLEHGYGDAQYHNGRIVDAAINEISVQDQRR